MNHLLSTVRISLSPTACRLFVGLFACLLATRCENALHGQQPASKEIYQDFRNKRPLLDDFRLRGHNVDAEMKAEAEGLRVTLPAERGEYWPSEVGIDVALSGDFEITATYELLSAKRPAKGYGVGVNLSIADSPKRARFAKVSRVMRADEGSVHMTEYWDRAKPGNYTVIAKKTEAKAGQLRLVRIGESLHCLVSDGPGQEFREIWAQPNFGAGDLDHNGLSVTDSGLPGNPVDARLIDLRVRLGNILADKATEAAPLPAPAIVPTDVPHTAEAPTPERSRNWLMAIVVIGLAIALLLALALGAVLFLRRGRSAAVPVDVEEAKPVSIVIACTGCGKKLKANPESAGKKIKCSQCGKAVLVPEME